MAFSLPSYAKINWTLRVLGKREDGFHELFTIFQTVSLHDTIHFAESADLELTCDDPAVPIDDRNLVLKAAKALQIRAAIKKGASIHLEKRIPSPGGLGGGSSNAVTALIGLYRLWGLMLGADEIEDLGGKLGSDVPFFLTGGTAIGTGRGEVIEPTSDIYESNVLIVTPDVCVRTPEAFADSGAPVLTKEHLNRSLTVCRNEANSSELLHQALKNDLEPSVFARFPEIERVKTTLLELGAVGAAMSGSGASVFAIFDKQETRQAAINALASERDWRKFAVSTVSRSEYCDALDI
jgi:4-diphosphocytidyl-2-C-methyl-D-erythritol kinase